MSLGESAEVGDAGRFIDLAIAGADDNLLLQRGKEEFGRMANSAKFSLIVLVNERSECQEEDLVTIEGIEFALPPNLREIVNGMQLDYEEGRLIIRGPRGEFENLRSIVERKHD